MLEPKKKKNNVVQLHSDKAMHAMRLMESRRKIDNEPDRVKRVAMLAVWKVEATEYWQSF